MSTSVSASSRELQEQLRGALAFPITPFAADGSVDLAAVRANTGILATSGIASIVAPSGTGEVFALTPEESTAVVAETVKAAGDKPVIAAAGFGPRLGAQMAREAEEAGASAIMVLPPYYAKPDPAALVSFIADIASGTSLPLIPYARDAALFSPKLFLDLVNAVPQVVAFKDGRADVRLFQQIREHVSRAVGPDRITWIAGSGDDLIGPYFAAGAEGYTSSLACFWPEASTELYELAHAGDYRELAKRHDNVVRPIYELRQRGPGFEVSVMKAAMEILGFTAGPARSPLGNPTPEERDELAAILTSLNVPTAADRGVGTSAAV